MGNKLVASPISSPDLRLDAVPILSYWQSRLRDEDPTSLAAGAGVFNLVFDMSQYVELAESFHEAVSRNALKKSFLSLYEAASSPKFERTPLPTAGTSSFLEADLVTEFGIDGDIDAEEQSEVRKPTGADAAVAVAFASHEKGKPRFIMWFPATITPSGDLKESEYPPQFLPSVLETARDTTHVILDYLTQSEPIVGTYDDYERACNQFGMGASTGISGYFRRALTLYNEVVHKPNSSLRVYMVPRLSGPITYHLNKCYDQLIVAARNDTLPPVVRMILAPGYPVEIGIQDPLTALPGSHVAGVDSLDDSGSRSATILNSSQRRALLCTSILHDENNEPKDGIVAVSGPPGTGKTAMLGTIIANEWTRAAIRLKKRPPITIACGATNQSIENVLATFDGVLGPDPDRLTKRWIPELSVPYCVSFPSGTKNKLHSGRYGILFKRELSRGRPRRADEKRIRKEAGWIRFGGRARYRGSSQLLNDLTAFDVPRLADQYLANLYEFASTSHGLVESSCKPNAMRTRLAQRSQELDQLLQENAPWNRIKDAVRKMQRGLFPAAKALSNAIADLENGQQQLRERLLQELSPEVIIDSLPLKYRELVPRSLDAMRRLTCTLSRLEREQCVEEVLDGSLRTAAFHLAARYWECQWLMQRPLIKPGTPPDEARWWRAAESPLQQLGRISMLCPCIVSTLYTVPGLCKPRGRDSEYEFASIDLLVIDEAGQALPDIGLPAMALAKRAVIVGDRKQLAPVSTIDAATEKRRLEHEGMLSDRCVERGADSASGSVMSLAATAASFRETNRLGLTLRDHYRCPESIISFCIDLKYYEHDKCGDDILLKELTPRKCDFEPGSLDDIATFEGYYDNSDVLQCKRVRAERFSKRHFPLPPLSYFQVGPIEDAPEAPRQDQDNSWYSNAEARAIAWWLHGTGLQLARWCAIRKNAKEIALEDIVAIVTPFRAQVSEIKKEIKKKFGGCKTINCLCLAQRGSSKPLEDRLTIGTAHTLQGDQRDVVLFSAVNSAPSQTVSGEERKVFIDRDGGNLLNVAASRAKAAFILFGHADLFFSPLALRPEADPNRDLPSALLGRWMAGVSEPAREKKHDVIRRPGVRIGPGILLAVESEPKAREMAKWLPPSVQVFATNGHVRVMRDINVGPSNGFTPTWGLNVSKRILDDVKKTGDNSSALRAHQVISERLDKIASRLIGSPLLAIGTDPDPEGEAIAWHLFEMLKAHPVLGIPDRSNPNALRMKRVLFGAPTREDVVVAIQESTDLQVARAVSAVARTVIDAAIGAWWRAAPRSIAAGRVTAPIYRALSFADQGFTTDDLAWRIGVELMGPGPRIPGRLARRTARAELAFSSRQLEDGADAAVKALADSNFEGCWTRANISVFAEPAPLGLGTADVLDITCRRWNWAPEYAMELLAALRLHSAPKRRKTAAFSGADEHVAAILRTREEISSVSFAKRVAALCETIADSGNDYFAAYAKAISSVCEELYEKCPSYVGRPEGKNGEASAAKDRFERQAWVPAHAPFVALTGTWEWPAEASSRRDIEEIARSLELGSLARRRIEAAQNLGRDVMHPPIMPINLKFRPDDRRVTDAYGFNSDLHKLYKLIWERTVAARLRPAMIKSERFIRSLGGPLVDHCITVDRYTLIDRGWFGAFRDIAAPWSGEKQDLANWESTEWEEFVVASRAIDGSRSLRGYDSWSKPSAVRIDCDTSVSGILRFMRTHDLGRPSTYASHLRRFLKIR